MRTLLSVLTSYALQLRQVLHANALNEVFDPSLVPALVGMLKLCLITPAVKEPKRALIALTVRNVDTLALFISSVKGKHAENQTP